MTSVAVVCNRKKMRSAVRGQLSKALADAGFGEAAWYEAPKGSACTAATKKALDDGADVIMAVGGDGTVRACAEALLGTDASLAVVPTGTANLFASALDLPTDPVDAVELVVSGNRRSIDVGRCEDQCFVVMAGSGFDAAMMRSADHGKDRLGFASYIVAGVKEAVSHEPEPVSVVVDGDRFYEGPASCVLVGNLGELKGGLVTFPDASPTDGLLEVGVLSASRPRDWLGLVARMAMRRPEASPHVHTTRGRDVTVRWSPGTHDKRRRRAAEQMPYQLDGGAKGEARKLRFRCEPAALHLLMPRGASK